MATIAAIYRYPVKGLSPERLDRVALTPGECLPHDRRFAVALPSTGFDPEQPKWLPKTCFAMLMRDEALARLATRFDAATGELSIAGPDGGMLRASLATDDGRRTVAAFLDRFLGEAVEHPLRIVAAPGHAFADARKRPNATSDKYVSLINLASIAELEAAVAAAVDPLRFRANVYFTGAPAWSELGSIEREIELGDARARIVSSITRCAATQVNPSTAARDLDVPAALQRHFGHNLMGVYAEILSSGEIAVGGALELAVAH